MQTETSATSGAVGGAAEPHHPQAQRHVVQYVAPYPVRGPVSALGRTRRHSTRRRSVTVIGAGIAGLVAGYELEQLGYEVQVLEASRRIGGRIYTYRFSNDPDAPVAELGAMRIPTKHSHTLRYIERLGLGDEVRPFKSLLADENAFLSTERGYVRLRDAPHALLAELRAGLPHNGYSDETLLFGAGLSLVVEAIAPPPVRHGLREDLNRCLLDLVDELDLRPCVGDPNTGRIDLHGVFARYPHLRDACSGDLNSFLDDILTETSPELVRVRGGMDRIVRRLSRRIHGAILCRRQVFALEVGPEAVRIQSREGDRIVTRHSDYVVCTVPFSVLRSMRLSGVSQDKADLIRDVQYVPATKVALYCREPFWQSSGIKDGASCPGGRIRQTYYPPVDGDPALGAVLLASYTIGDDANVLGRLAASARHSAIVTELGEMHPELLRPGMVVRAASVAWGQYKWSRGGCAVRWGKDAATCEIERTCVSQPEGRLFFAGEHCSSRPAWIDGAIESAKEAVGQLVRSDAQDGPAVTEQDFSGTVEAHA